MTHRTYTHPGVLTLGIRQGRAEADPARIGWLARQDGLLRSQLDESAAEPGLLGLRAGRMAS